MALLANSSTQTLGQQQSSTAREYFEDLRNLGNLPSWAINVCFTDDESTPIWYVTASKARSQGLLTMRMYIRDIGGNVWHLRRVTGDKHDAKWSMETENEDDPKDIGKMTFRLNWDTGGYDIRYTYFKHPEKSYAEHGQCEAVAD